MYSLLDCRADSGGNFGDGEALLSTRIAMTKCDSILQLRSFAECVKIYCDAKRRAYLVLPAITFADIAVVVPRDSRMHFLQFSPHFSRLLYELRLILQER